MVVSFFHALGLRQLELSIPPTEFGLPHSRLAPHLSEKAKKAPFMRCLEMGTKVEASIMSALRIETRAGMLCLCRVGRIPNISTP